MASSPRKKQFLLCVRNVGCDDLELRKLYQRVPDRRAASDGYVRVIDESGEDYLYPEGYFVAVKLPSQAERALARQAPARSAHSPLQRTAPTRRR
jgi:hypothetical protein